MEKSEISWTDGSWNPWEGCAKISPGCANCYAENRDIRFNGGKHWGKGSPRKKGVHALKNLAKWNERARKGFFVRCLETGVRGWLGADHLPPETAKAVARPIFFSLSLGDIFDAEIDPLWLAEALNAAILAPDLDLMFLTKRPEAWGERMGAAYIAAKSEMSDAAAERLKQWMTGERIPQNIAFGATVESGGQRARIGWLLQIPVVRRFLSMEPLLGPPDWLEENEAILNGIDLVIVGGESGDKARPMFPEWPRMIETVCDSAGVAFHFKQWGEWITNGLEPMPASLPVIGNALKVTPNGSVMKPDAAGFADDRFVWRMGTKKAGHALDCTGRTRREMLAFPSASWRLDWHQFAGLPWLPPRAFPSRFAADEFLARHPEAEGKIAPMPMTPPATEFVLE